MALFTDRRLGGGASLAMQAGMAVANAGVIDPRNFSAGRKAGMRTRSRNDRMTGTVMDIQSGQAAVFSNASQRPPAVLGQMTGASQNILPQNVGRVRKYF